MVELVGFVTYQACGLGIDLNSTRQFLGNINVPEQSRAGPKRTPARSWAEKVAPNGPELVGHGPKLAKATPGLDRNPASLLRIEANFEILY